MRSCLEIAWSPGSSATDTALRDFSEFWDAVLQFTGAAINAAAQGFELFVPLREHRGYIDPYQMRLRDSRAVAELRLAHGHARGAADPRAATTETVNADLRTRRGLDRLLVRGSTKVLTAALWSAMTYNLLHAITPG